jgi:indolepyruvate ferredoxin oxidoreductase alpha subunit
MRQLLTTNQAIAQAAVDAGISVASGYPGTPSSETLEYVQHIGKGILHADWAVNEKVALEICAGASYVGRRSICTMKHVGLNVAADSFINLAYTGVNGGLVLFVADDPGIHSSQNEQDSRFYADFAKVFCFEPSNPQQAYEMTYAAFEISETTESPVMIRSVTRLSHGNSAVETQKAIPQKPFKMKNDKEKWLLIPRISRERHKVLNRKQMDLLKISESSSFNQLELRGRDIGVIVAGNAINYYEEVIDSEREDYSVLRIGAYPLPRKLIDALTSHVKKVMVIEEGEPYIERMLIEPKVMGKLSSYLPLEGELSPEILSNAFGKEKKIENEKDLPIRLPEICTGCGYTKIFEAVKEVKPSIVAGDIGCYTLGALYPHETMNTVLCMGASINMAAGMYYGGAKEVLAIIGDSTFIHSGISSLIDASYNKAAITVLIIDNGAIAMTGAQDTPSSPEVSKNPSKNRISLEQILDGLKVPYKTFMSWKKEEGKRLLEEALKSNETRVVIAQSPCLRKKR